MNICDIKILTFFIFIGIPMWILAVVIAIFFSWLFLYRRYLNRQFIKFCEDDKKRCREILIQHRQKFKKSINP